MSDRALFVRDGSGFVGTDVAQGAWNPADAIGGAVLALLGHCLDEVPSLVPMTMSRMTVDIMRPVPLGRRLTVAPVVVREGRKIQLVDLQLTVGGVLHARASVLRLRDADLTGRDDLPTGAPVDPPVPLVPPDQVASVRDSSTPPGGFLQGWDMRYAPSRDGSATGLWVRLEVPVVAGEPVRPSARLVACVDFANNIGVDFGPGAATTINPDVNAHVLRRPAGEWVAITGETRFTPALGRGVVTATLSDLEGVFAAVSLSQLVQPRAR
jgi:hypothetical protein